MVWRLTTELDGKCADEEANRFVCREGAGETRCWWADCCNGEITLLQLVPHPNVTPLFVDLLTFSCMYPENFCNETRQDLKYLVINYVILARCVVFVCSLIYWSANPSTHDCFLMWPPSRTGCVIWSQNICVLWRCMVQPIRMTFIIVHLLTIQRCRLGNRRLFSKLQASLCTCKHSGMFRFWCVLSVIFED